MADGTETQRNSNRNNEQVEDEAAYDHELAHFGPTAEIDDWKPGADSPESSTVYDSERRLLTMYEDVAGNDLPKRKTFEEIAKSRNSLAYMHTKKAVLIAWKAIRNARLLLRRGPLNQMLPLDDASYPATPLNLRGDIPPRYRCAPDSPKYLSILHGGMVDALMKFPPAAAEGPDAEAKFVTPFERMLSTFYATAFLGCGVCSDISALTTGLLTMLAVPKSSAKKRRTSTDSIATILRLSHNSNHSFTLFSYGLSPWIVVDPWVMEPYVVDIDNNYFPRSGISAFTELRVFESMEAPFGIPSMAAWDEDTIEGPDRVKNLLLTNARIRQAIDDISTLVETEAGAGLHDVDGPPIAVKNGCWTANLVAERTQGAGIDVFDKFRNFHVDHPWTHMTNHLLQDKDAEYAEFRASNPPAAHAKEWGEDVEDDD